MKRLIEELFQGNRRSAARLISMIENEDAARAGIMRALKPHTGRAHRIGITGAPGSGKSTLINGMIGTLRKQGRKVGVIAVDPTSPLTGGALLGDRIRMQEHAGDEGVFIRSMASRKGTGGISRAAGEAGEVLDALGMDTVFLETTGTGQSETAVRNVVDTVVVVVDPGLGDDIQMMKAGVLEIADVIVVNKGDIKNAERTADDLRKIIEIQPRSGKRSPVIVTVAPEGKGIARLLEAVEAHGQKAGKRKNKRLLSQRRKARKEMPIVQV